VLGVTATAAGRDTQTPVDAGRSLARSEGGPRGARRPAGRDNDGNAGRDSTDSTGPGRRRLSRPSGGGPGSGRWLLDLPGGSAPRQRGRRELLSRIGVLSVAIGVVTALLALPVAAGVGLFSKATADHYMSLPAILARPPLPQNSEILASDGSVIATLHGAENRVVVSGTAIPTIMRQAIVAIEDARFYQHGGFDPKGLLRAALRNSQAGDVQQGGSTLTQQYVKNVLLQNATTAAERKAATGTSLSRKMQELRYASELEKIMPKDEILTNYLNIAYFGDGAYGVGTAAEHYFGVDVSQLNLDQAALLAGLVQSPSRYNPVTNPKDATTRRNEVLDHLVTSKYVSQTQADAAKQIPITLHVTSGTSVDPCAESVAPFFCDYVRTQLLGNPALGSTADERQRQLYEGGLKIHTTLDPKVQSAAQNAVDSIMGPTNSFAGIEAVIQPGTGNILAMAVNQRYGSNTSQHQTKLPLFTGPLPGKKADGAFQPGSTMKLFTMLTALEQGYGTSTAFYSPACYTNTTDFPMAPRTNSPGCEQGYQNSDPAEANVYDMSTGTWKSVNTYYVQLEDKVGVVNVVNMAERLGLPKNDFDGTVGPTLGGLTIGQGVQPSPLEMANAYATVASGGLLCTPRFVASATDSSNENVDIAPAPSCKRVLDEGIANTASSVLEGVITSGTGNPNADIGRPAAGKTGTNDEFASAWFDGFVPQMAAAVVVGDPTGDQGHKLRNVQADGQVWAKVYGGDLPAMIWSATFRAALQGEPVLPLPQADPQVAQGTKGGLQNPGDQPTPSASPGLVNPLTGQPITGLPGDTTLTPTVPGGGSGNGNAGRGGKGTG
jgi:membrane peptidoglycan carboxypeptidase